MLKIVIKKLTKLLGMKELLLKVGDIAVKATKSTKDDEVWAKAISFIKKL